MSRTIIAFCGAAGAGKDEAAKALLHLGFTKRSFAEPLRAEVHRSLKHKLFPLKAPREVVSALSGCIIARDTDPWVKPTSPRMRRLLQLWGTDWRRKQDRDYWTKAEARTVPEHGRFFYTDVRFPNEVELVRSLGGLLYRIDRPNWPVLDHESESHWPHFKVDAVIRNDGSIADLHEATLAAIPETLWAVAPSLLHSSSVQPQSMTTQNGS